MPFLSLSSVAFQSGALCSDLGDEERSSQLKALLMDYFEEEADPAFLKEEAGAEDLQKIRVRRHPVSAFSLSRAGSQTTLSLSTRRSAVRGGLG